MPPPLPFPRRIAPTLDRHGAAARCLLRLRENAGNPPISDRQFIQTYRARFPHWDERPGQLDAAQLGELACLLQLAPGGYVVLRDYSGAMQLHREGAALIALTERSPLQVEQAAALRPHALLIEQIDEHGFVGWCPFENGGGDQLPRAARRWWDLWRTRGIAFRSRASH
jgi:hypothetical protein